MLLSPSAASVSWNVKAVSGASVRGQITGHLLEAGHIVHSLTLKLHHVQEACAAECIYSISHPQPRLYGRAAVRGEAAQHCKVLSTPITC